MQGLPEELIEQIRKLIGKVRELEQAFLKIQSLVFPTDKGRFSPPKYTTDPASPANGDIWYNMTTHKFRGRANGSSVDLH